MESTQAVARALAEDGAAEGTTVVAAQQTGGRGRLGNTFFSPPGGLYLSIVLRPELAPSVAPLISLALGLAVAEAVQATTGLAPFLKWPNDVLLNGCKVSGVLVDLAAGRDGIRWAIAGAGVNVDVGAFPPELRQRATSLSLELGRSVSLDTVRAALLARFEARYRQLLAGGGQALLAAWSAAPNLLGQRVLVAAEDPPLAGIAERLDADGALLLRLPSGELRRVVAADVHLLPPTGR